MNTPELKALAVDASGLMTIAVIKASNKLSEDGNQKYRYLYPTLSRLAECLMEVTLILQRPLLNQEARVNRRLPGLLTQLERVCDVSPFH